MIKGVDFEFFKRKLNIKFLVSLNKIGSESNSNERT